MLSRSSRERDIGLAMDNLKARRAASHKKYYQSEKGKAKLKVWRRQNYLKNKEKILARQKISYEKHKEKRRQGQKSWARFNRMKNYEDIRRWIHDNPRRRILTTAKTRAKQKGVPFNIDLSDIVIPEYCPILGIKLVWDRLAKSGRSFPHTPSLDRIIPELGYVKGNVQVISWRANTLKNNGTIKEFERLIAYLKRHQAAARDEEAELYSMPIANPLAWSFGS